MSPFSHEPREPMHLSAQFVAECAKQLSRLAHATENALFAAVLDISSADVLHSVNRSLDLDPEVLSRAAGRLVRWHRISEAAPQFKGPLLDLLYVSTGSFHLLRPLRERSNLALYLAVRGKPVRVARARDALREAARALEASARSLEDASA